MFSRLIYPIWSPFARPIRMGHGEKEFGKLYFLLTSLPVSCSRYGN